MLALIFIVGIPISIADVSSFRIPNIYIKLLAYGVGVTITWHGFGSVKNLSFFFLSLILIFSIGIGMGDIKLLLIIGVVLNASADINLFLFYLALLFWTSFHSVMSYLASGSFKEKIPMAPSIFATLGVYLAA